jgi:hypothetical protein
MGDAVGTSGFIDFSTPNNNTIVDTLNLTTPEGYPPFWGDGITPGSGIMPLSLPGNSVRTKFNYEGSDLSGNVEYEIELDIRLLENRYTGLYNNIQTGEYGGCSGSLVDLVTSGEAVFFPSLGVDPDWEINIQNINELVIISKLPVNDGSDLHKFSFQSFTIEPSNDDNVFNTSTALSADLTHDIIISDSDVNLPEITTRFTNKTYTIRNKGGSPISITATSSSIDGDVSIPAGESRKYAADVTTDTWFQI